MTMYEITIQGSRRLPITVHAESDRDVDGMIYDGLESGGFVNCDGCDEWYPEVEMRALKGADGDRHFCDDCHAEVIASRYRHEDGCRCNECCEGRAMARGEI